MKLFQLVPSKYIRLVSVPTQTDLSFLRWTNWGEPPRLSTLNSSTGMKRLPAYLARPCREPIQRVRLGPLAKLTIWVSKSPSLRPNFFQVPSPSKLRSPVGVRIQRVCSWSEARGVKVSDKYTR